MSIELNLDVVFGGASSGVLVSDPSNKLVYLNEAAKSLIQRNEGSFKSTFSRFNFSDPLNSTLLDFNPSPSSIADRIKSDSNFPLIEDIKVGENIYSFSYELLKSSSGREGVKLEIRDVTAIKENENQALRFGSSIEGSSTAMMTIDRDFNIMSVNPATRKLFQDNLSTFQTAFPGFDPKTIIGTCIDRFHKNPDHQRKLLSTTNNLPFQTDIQVGDLTFELNVTAMMNRSGDYIGNSLEWANVTEARKQAAKAESLNSMIEGASAYFMTCDNDFRITYLNPSLKKMLSKYESKIKTALPSFSTNNLMGVSIDTFHKDPSLQRRVLRDTSNMPYKTEIDVAGLRFGLTATVLFDDRGNLIGNGVEWADYNDRVDFQNEVSRISDHGRKGEIKERGKVDMLSEQYQPMMTWINEILDAVVAPIDNIKGKLEIIASGDLTSYITDNYEGEYKALQNALNSSLDALNKTLNEVQSMSIQIAQSSNEVSESSQAVSQGAANQASSLEEITAAMTEMMDQTNQNSVNADKAKDLTQSAQTSARSGDDQMKQMMQAMSDIDESSKGISKIIKTIDSIAFQTNLLALNAAVEAARAGEHGKGFAVVAEEVRNLAGRSANAARETTEMIEASIGKVNLGSKIANQTAESLTEIVEQVAKATDFVSEIAAASKEQARGISEISAGLKQVEDVTTQNTTLSERSAAAAEELSAQASKLEELLKQFSLKQTEVSSFSPQALPSGGMSSDMMAQFQEFMRMQNQNSAPNHIPERITHNDEVSLSDKDFGKY